MRDILPDGYEYKILRCNEGELKDDNMSFTAEVRVNCQTEADVKQFLSDFNISSGCSYNMAVGRQDKRQEGRSSYRGYRKCCLNVSKEGDRKDLQPGKNTVCPACLNFRLENPIAKKLGKSDRENYTLWTKISFTHNHSLNRADYLKFLDVNEVTKSIYWEMFENGLLPSSAHIARKQAIKSEFPDTWPQIFADRSKLPSLFWVFHFHRQFLDRQIGSRDGVDVFVKCQEVIKQFETECQADHPLPDGKNYAMIVQTEDGETVVVICDPFMHRVHSMVPQAGELVLIDATSNLDRSDTKLIHVVCPSPIGSLPLADIIVTREDTNTLTFAFELMKSVLPDRAFYDRGGHRGPQCIMTDDADAERLALAEAWPGAALLLCSFHVLQACWTWLWDAKHKIEHSDRPTLLILFRHVLYAETEAELSDKLEELYADETANNYPQFFKHLQKHTFPKIKAWSVQRRISECLPTSSNNTNNYVESSFRYVKDIMFGRLRAFNLTEMLSIVLDRSEWYINKVIDAANDRIESWLKNCHSKYVIKMPNIDPTKIVQVSPITYLVPSETDQNTSYMVDMETRRCTCPQGRLAGPCKHKYLVAHSKHLPTFDVIPTNSPVMRQLYMFLGTGKHTELSWFLPKQAPSVVGHNAVPIEVRDEASEHVDGFRVDAENGLEMREAVERETIDPQDVKEKLQEALKRLSDKVMARIESDPEGYSKSIKIFEKTVDKLPNKSDSALQKSLCCFGKSVIQVNI